MPNIMLRDGFRDIQPGDAQTLEVRKVTYDEKFQKIRVTFADEHGGTCTENFSLVKNNGEVNDVAYGIFSTIYKCCTHDESNREVDPTDIQGRVLVADVYRQEGKDKDGNGTGRFYTHLRNYQPVDEPSEGGNWYD